MNIEDMIYICRSIGDLSGIPVRLFCKDKLILFHSVISLCKDPLLLYEKDVLAVKQHIGYYITPNFSYYGILNSGSCQMVIGPTRQVAINTHEIKELAFQLDVPSDDYPSFIDSVKSIVSFPLESLMQMLCVTNFALNHEKLSISDLVLVDSNQTMIPNQLLAESSSEDFDTSPSDTYQQASSEAKYNHNSKHIEDQLMKIIESGDIETLEAWINQAPAIRPGILSNSQLRHHKNVFIVSATLFSRAAIKGGLSENTAFGLSDAYIQKCELLTDVARITNLEYHMVMDFTERVSRIKIGEHPSALALQVSNYVANHIYENILAEDLSAHLFISKSWLFAKFKADTGMTLKNYILKQKTEEAKRLLCLTDKPASSIGALLAFSSQSHFNRVFLKYAGVTPLEFREQNM